MVSLGSSEGGCFSLKNVEDIVEGELYVRWEQTGASRPVVSPGGPQKDPKDAVCISEHGDKGPQVIIFSPSREQ